MMMKTGRTTPLNRVLAILLSLLMLLQSASVFAEDTTTLDAVPETVQGVITEPVSDDLAVPAENAPAETVDTPNEGGKTPAEETGTINGTPETPDEASGETGEPGETANGEENTGIPEENAAAPAAQPVIDTSESITMTEAGYVPAPPYFEGTLVHEGLDYTITAVIGTDAMFPEDVQMRVSEILPGTEQYELYNQMMEETLEEGEELGEFARYFDISFITVVDGVETEIEPQADINVQITFQETIALTEESDVQAIHIAENTPEILKTVTDSLEAAVNDDEAIDTVTFSADSFSIYGVVQKIKKILKVITASGATFTVDVTFTSDANIPEDAELIATEITPNDANYNIYREQTALALGADDVKLPGLFDLGIYVNGEKIQPEAPVSVAISLKEGIQEGEKLYVVHFPEGIEAAKEPEPAEAAPKLMAAPRMMHAAAPMTQPAEEQATEQQTTEKLETDATEPETKNETPAVATEVVSEVAVEGETVTFAANGFSVYALAYTVDFEYSVNGKTYQFSLPGGGSVTLHQLVEALGINEDTNGADIDRFIADIKNAEFSDPSLVWVGRAEEDTSVGALKDGLGLLCEYSGELSEKQIGEINGNTVSAGEWILISLKAFDTEETMTVTMKDGEVWTVEVTDAQISADVLTAGGETYTVTVEYDDDARIPDGAHLRATEIAAGSDLYGEYLTASVEELGADSESISLARFFDIRIVETVDGAERELEPEAPVKVTIALKEELREEDSLSVVHFLPEGPQRVEGAQLNEREDVEFTAESFSVYGVITMPAPTGADDLDGRTFTMSIGGRYVTDQAQTPLSDSSNTNGLGKTINASEAAQWRFEQVSGSTYRIVNTDDGRYLTFTKNPEAQSARNTRAHATLTDDGTVFTVEKVGSGYRISALIDGTTYYLDEHNGSTGPGFAGWYIAGENNTLTLNFTQPATQANQEYMVLVKLEQDGEDVFYIVLNDGSLSPAQYNPASNKVIVEDPMMWKYDGERLYHVTREAGYTGDDIASDSYYRYIDPSAASGLNEDDETNTTSHEDNGVRIDSRSLWDSVRLIYTSDHKLCSANSNDYIGAEGGSLKGQVSAADAVEVFLALPEVQEHDWARHSVNHIDISINGTAEVDVPLAYGKYYDEHGNLVKVVPQNKFEKLHLSAAQVVDLDELTITPADMKRSYISASCNGEKIDNAFYITGYSGNAEHAEHTGDDPDHITSPQVRIEGSFLTAKMPAEHATLNTELYDNDPDYRTAIRNERLANKVEYSVSIVKSVQFNLQIPVDDGSGNTVYQQLYDADGNPLTIRADVSFSDSFDYWNSENDCPVFTDTNKWYYYKNYRPTSLNAWNGDDWEAGDVARCNFSGMDFKLGGSGSGSATQVYAIEIIKIVVDEQGNRIRSENAGTADFSIYRRQIGTIPFVTGTDGIEYLDVIKPIDDDVKDLNIGSFTSDEAYAGNSDYAYLREKSIQVGGEGFGMVYDYNVTPGIYYVEEDPSSVEETITDTSGKTWDYKETYILTEYAWRNHPNDNYMHVGRTYTEAPAEGGYKSTPEILGNHYGYDGEDGPYTNAFLEFYVYNVYEAPKVDVPVMKTWDDFASDEFDWRAEFKLQWAPVYPDETKTTVAFQDVSPERTVELTKAMMAAAADGTETPEQLAARTFADLPKYGTDQNGETFRYQYSLEEISYQVWNSSTGVVLYEYSKDEGYSGEDSDTIYLPFYPHNAGENDSELEEENAANENYYISVENIKKDVRESEYIDINLEKRWDESFPARDDTYWAEFELRRFSHTEYRDLSEMSDNDRTAAPVTVTIVHNGEVVSTLQTQPNMGLYLGGNFMGHSDVRSATFTSNHPVRLANGSNTTTLTAQAGANMSNAVVRTQEFFVVEDTVFTIDDGFEYLVADRPAKVLDTSAGTSPLPDHSFSRTIRLDSTNSWQTALEDLLLRVASGDSDNENVACYEYYLVEKDSNPKGYAQYFRLNGDGTVSTTLSGDADHQIETDDSIVAMNGPSNRLRVKKLWRGVPDNTGFPAITFTLYQTWADGNDGWVYENPDTGARYEHIELSGNVLEWICPESLPATRLDGSTSRAVKYYVMEDEQSGSVTNGGVNVGWMFYYYLTSEGQQTNAGHQGYFAAIRGQNILDNPEGGTITICNAMNAYMQMDIQKQFFLLRSDGSWDNVTSHADMRRGAILGFQVIRAVKAPDGKWLDARGNESDTPVWMDYGEEMLCGYDENGRTVVSRGENDIFWLHDAGGDWHFRIENNEGDHSNVSAGGAGLPSYGFFIRNGEDLAVEYWYSFREIGVYKNLNKDPYPEWDWFSSVTPVNAYGPNGTMEAFPKAFHGQDGKRIANFQASDLYVDKDWIGEPTATKVYIKIWRTSGDGEPEDFTAIIADDIRSNSNWQYYVNDVSSVDLGRNCLVLDLDASGSGTAAIKVNRAMLGALSETGSYNYYIQEIGYRDNLGVYQTNVNAAFKPLYDHWVNGAYTGSPAQMNDYASNSITIVGKGQNRLKVTNSAEPSTSYTVQKAFHGSQSATGGPSSVTGRYPTDGSKQVVIELQQRYRYEKNEEGVDYVSSDGENWVRADSTEAAETWIVDWQAAESASPQSVTLPKDKPDGSILSDEAWYGSAAAWSYTWEGLDVVKEISGSDDSENRVVQLYYRAVETGTPDWFSMVLASEEQNGHKAVADDNQTAAQLLAERNTVTNERAEVTLELNKEWTGLGEGTTWPSGYVVYYQLEQHYHLAGGRLNGGVATYYYGETIKTVDMTTSPTDATGADNVHPGAFDTLEESNHNLTLSGLPMFGFFTATEADVEEAAEHGVALTAGTVYPVVYTYSVRETAVKKDGVDVDFTAQTVDFTLKQDDGQDEPSGNNVYEATLTNEMVSVDVTKTWGGSDPYADNVTVKLYRTTEIPADELCRTTINVSFGDNYEHVTDSTITATVGGKTVTLTQEDGADLWTGTVNLEKGSTVTVSFTAPEVNDGFMVTLNNVQVEVPDAETHAVDITGLVTERQEGRTITVNVTWSTEGDTPWASYSNLFYTGWQNTNISATTSMNGNTQTFIFSGAPTSGSSVFVQLGYNGYDLRNNYTVNVSGSNSAFNGNNELILGDIPSGESNLTINVAIGPGTPTPEGTASVTLVNESGNGIWINQLTGNGGHGNFGGWLNDGGRNTISKLPAGSYTVQLGVATVDQIVGADSVEQWGGEADPNVNIHITLADDEQREIHVMRGEVSAPSGFRSMRLGSDLPAMGLRAAAPSSVTVNLEHDEEDNTLTVIGTDDYPIFTQAEFLDEQTLSPGNSWHYQWTGLAASDPETGAKYYYYVVEEVPGGTKTVTYDRSESNGSTVVTIDNQPVTTQEYASLKVTKSVVDEENTALDISRVFTIRLKQDDKYLKWIASDDYEWVTQESEAGIWTFNNSGSVTFIGLEPGHTYTVVEDTGTGMIEIEGYDFVSTDSYTVSINSSSTVEGTITNVYRLSDITINILKVNATDMTTPLEKAQFTLTKLNPDGKGDYLTPKVEIKSSLTDADGEASIEGISTGYYEIAETILPSGCVLTGDGKFYIHVDNGNIALLTKDPEKVVTDWDGRILTEEDKLDFDADTTTFTVGNTPGVELPSTGGPGTNLLYLLGSMLVMLAGAGFILLQRKKRVE